MLEEEKGKDGVTWSKLVDEWENEGVVITMKHEAKIRGREGGTDGCFRRGYVADRISYT